LMRLSVPHATNMNSSRAEIIWSKDAENDLFEIWAYLAHEASPEVATDQLRELQMQFQFSPTGPSQVALETTCDPAFAQSSSLPTLSSIASDQSPEIVRVLHSRRDIDGVFGDSQIR